MRQSEIGDMRRTIKIQQNVLRFQIAMDNAFFVSVVDGVGDGATQTGRFRGGRTVHDHPIVLQRHPFDQFTGDEGRADVPTHFVSGDDVGMFQLAAALASRTNASSSAETGVTTSDFQRDFAIEIRVERSPYCTESAAPQAVDQLEMCHAIDVRFLPNHDVPATAAADRFDRIFSHLHVVVSWAAIGA